VVGGGVAAVLLRGDDGGGGSDIDANNEFDNGGFEDDLKNPCVADTLDCWFYLRPPGFNISDVRARSDDHSALLMMRDTAQSEETKIYYLVQEVDPQTMPEVISGEYFVENWVKGTELQYLQFVVIAFGGGENLPECPGGGACPNYQIRYLLAGIDREPFSIGNAKFVFLTEEDPVQGEWVHFERNLRQDFIDLWGGVPNGFTKLRVLFEVRYDAKQATEGPLEADVYYDDLYMGPAR
jgi:hypothetical protein